jgi:hypothetical protein
MRDSISTSHGLQIASRVQDDVAAAEEEQAKEESDERDPTGDLT